EEACPTMKEPIGIAEGERDIAGRIKNHEAVAVIEKDLGAALGRRRGQEVVFLLQTNVFRHSGRPFAQRALTRERTNTTSTDRPTTVASGERDKTLPFTVSRRGGLI